MALLSPVMSAFNHEYMIEYAKITYRKHHAYHELTQYINPMSTHVLYGTYVGIGTKGAGSKTMYHVEDSYYISTCLRTV